MDRKFIRVRDIQIKADTNGNKFNILSDYLDLRSPCSSNLSLPRSGRYFIECLKDINLIGKSVLDIGTGYFGFLANHAAYFGARRVVAVDINQEAIKHARTTYNLLGIDYRVSDIYSSIKADERFDVIISNPPQLPSNSGGNMHDVSGLDGLNAIKAIIDGANYYLAKDGEIYLLIFDFLYKNTKLYCAGLDMECKIICQYKKELRPNGETAKRSKYIEKIYPKYKFMKKNGTYHRIYILKITKT